MSVVIPHWDDLPAEVRDRLINLAGSNGIDINDTNPLTQARTDPDCPGLFLLSQRACEMMVFELYTVLYLGLERLQKEHRENAGPTRSP